MPLGTLVAMAQRSNREIVDQFVRAIEEEDIEGQVALLADDFIEEMPQSGERTRGPENYRRVVENYPGGIGRMDVENKRIIGSEDRWVMGPSFNALRIEGSGDIYTYVGTVRYAGGDVWQVIAIVQLRDGKIVRQTTWYAAPFEAPEWRAAFVERFPGLGS
jgi:ketosteroid isomerase-like protein